MPQSIDKVKFLTRDELTRLIRAIDSKRDRALFLIAYRHGLRVSEVGKLRVSDFDAKQLQLRCHRVKGLLSGVHPMQPDEVRLLKAYLKERADDSPISFLSRHALPLSRGQLHRLMGQYGERAGLPEDKHHFHVLRHTCGVDLYGANKDLRFVQHWLGHSQIQNTVIYTHLSAESIAEDARSAFSKLPKF